MAGDAATVRAALVTVIVLLGGPLGCGEYVDRKDTIAFSAGNAVQTNIVTHFIDPWPVNARNKNFAVNGQRMQRAVENYRCGKIGGAAAAVESDASAEGAAAAAPAPAPAEGGQGAC